MSEGYSIANTDKITAEYLRSIGSDKQKIAQAEFNRIEPALLATARAPKESRFEVVIPSFIYYEFTKILKERGFINICSIDGDVLGTKVLVVRFEW